MRGSDDGSEPERLTLRTDHGPVTLGFDRGAEAVFLIARDRASRWPVGLLREGRADLMLPEGPRSGTPRLVTDPVERDRILAGFRRKYGAERFARWYDHPARVLEVRLGEGTAPAGPGTDRYYGWLEAEFDNVASDYDRHILGNRMNRLLRERSLAWLRPRFAGRRRILEVGCGSGMETIPMLEAGHSLVAVDISDRMLATTRAKADAAGVGDRLETRRTRARDLERLVGEFGEGAFDAAYSTYGALNCEPDLRPVPAAFHRLLAPGAPLVVGVYNRWCLFELLGYGATLQPRRAFGRRRNPIPVGASRFCVDVYAHSVADFAHLFADGFTIERIEGVPVLLPPSDLTGYAERFARRFERLAALDAWAGRRWPFDRLGDHFLMTFVRGRGPGAGPGVDRRAP